MAHKVDEVRRWLARHPRQHVHYTPTSANWINLVERLFAEVTERCVRRGSHTSVQALEKAMLEYLDRRNRKPTPFIWKAAADPIFGKVQRWLLRAIPKIDPDLPEVPERSCSLMPHLIERRNVLARPSMRPTCKSTMPYTTAIATISRFCRSNLL